MTPEPEPTIPRTFHRIWLGSDLPGRYDAWGRTWLEHNPGWDLVTWTEENLPTLVNQDLFDRSDAWAQKADIARYEIIHRFGGVYLDCDFEAYRPLEPLIEGLSFFGAFQGGPVLTNGIFGASPQHPALAACVEELRASYIGRAGAGIPQQTGPDFFTRCVTRVLATSTTPNRVFATPTFFPIPLEGDRTFDPSTSRAIAAHHWGGSDGWATGSVDQAPGSAWPVAIVDRARLVPRVVQHRADLAAATLRSTARRRVKATVEGARDRLLDLGLITRHQPCVYIGDGRLLTMTRRGTPLIVLADDLSITPYLALTGTYEDNLGQFIDERVGPGDVVVDVGANIGLFTTLLAAKVGATGHVFAYECNARVLPVLRDNVQLNWKQDTVTVVPNAATSEAGTIEFAAPESMFGLGSTVISREIGPASIETVVGERVDERVPAGTKVRLVKIDVEGGELGVLRGMSTLIDEGRVQLVVLEFGFDRQEHVWDEITELFTTYERDHGARFGAVDSTGGIERLQLDEVLLVADFGNLVIEFGP